MIEGPKVIINDKEYILADFNFKTIQKVFPYIALLSKPTDPNYMEAVLKVITAALQRNYPDISEDFISENLQYTEIEAVMNVLTDQFTKKKTVKPPTTNQSTGEIFTQVSSLPQDGPGNI